MAEKEMVASRGHSRIIEYSSILLLEIAWSWHGGKGDHKKTDWLREQCEVKGQGAGVMQSYVKAEGYNFLGG